MTVFVVNDGALRSSGPMPQQLVGHMSPDTWSYLITMYNGSAGTGTCHACLVECAICWLCAFPCIFLCHPCIADRFIDAQRRNEILRLNQTLFNGLQVISIPDHGGLIFNTDCLLNSQPTIYQPTYMPPPQHQDYAQQPPAMAVAYSINEPTHYPADANKFHPPSTATTYSSSPPPPPPPPIVQGRLMQVTIPEGTNAGDSITVISPEGQRIVATVPQGMCAGMTFQIAY